jgi:hypothetical protein
MMLGWLRWMPVMMRIIHKDLQISIELGGLTSSRLHAMVAPCLMGRQSHHSEPVLMSQGGRPNWIGASVYQIGHSALLQKSGQLLKSRLAQP